MPPPAAWKLELTAHRVFPAMRTGGERDCEERIRYRIRRVGPCRNEIEPTQIRIEITLLDYGVMIGPSDFEPVCKILNGTCAMRRPDQQSHCCRTKSSDHPEKTLHWTSATSRPGFL